MAYGDKRIIDSDKLIDATMEVLKAFPGLTEKELANIIGTDSLNGLQLSIADQGPYILHFEYVTTEGSTGKQSILGIRAYSNPSNDRNQWIQVHLLNKPNDKFSRRGLFIQYAKSNPPDAFHPSYVGIIPRKKENYVDGLLGKKNKLLVDHPPTINLNPMGFEYHSVDQTQLGVNPNSPNGLFLHHIGNKSPMELFGKELPFSAHQEGSSLIINGAVDNDFCKHPFTVPVPNTIAMSSGTFYSAIQNIKASFMMR